MCAIPFLEVWIGSETPRVIVTTGEGRDGRNDQRRRRRCRASTGTYGDVSRIRTSAAKPQSLRYSTSTASIYGCPATATGTGQPARPSTRSKRPGLTPTSHGAPSGQARTEWPQRSATTGSTPRSSGRPSRTRARTGTGSSSMSTTRRCQSPLWCPSATWAALTEHTGQLSGRSRDGHRGRTYT